MNIKTPNQARNDGSSLSKEDILGFKDSLKGTVLLKSEASKEEYSDAVKRWNEVYIKQANMIVYVEDEEDIIKCIQFVDKHNIDVAVAGGRHSYHGASSSTGLVIDLRKMRKVAIDKAAMTATAQGGCIARDVEQPAQVEGLSVVFGAINETGIGGLTLGGGLGWLSGRYGLSIDNLLSARLVLANCEIVNVSEEENADLFWAIRGGGGNFGIVTEFKFKAHKQGLVCMQIWMFSPDKLQACIGLINKMHTASIDFDGKLQVMLGLLTPPGSPAMCPAYLVFYDGPEEEGKALIKPILDLQPVGAMGGVTPYAKTTEVPPMMLMDGFDRYAASSAHLTYPLDENLVTDFFEHFRQVAQKYGKDAHPSKCVLDLRNYQKVASVPVSATAFSGRADNAFFMPDLQWDDPKLDAKMREEVSAITTYVREKLQAEMVAAHVQGEGQRDVTTIYPNIGIGTEKAKSVFGPNLPKLQELKRKYDPDCMWDKWFPIMPA